MYKRLLLSLLFTLSLSPLTVMAQTINPTDLPYNSYSNPERPPLEARVSRTMTVDEARREAFANLVPMIDTSSFEKIDPNLLENIQARRKGQAIIEGKRKITVFGKNLYAVAELCSLQSPYYSSDGHLIAIDINSDPRYPDESCPVKGFPSTSYKYSISTGKLTFIGLRPSMEEVYSFLPDGTMSGHWIGDQCIKTNGASCGTRHTFITGE